MGRELHSIRKQYANPRKVYSVDAALAEDVSFKFTEDKGRVIENIVFIELKRRNKEVFYHKGKYECDFVLKSKLKIVEAIQVCYELNENNKEREINGLKEAMDKLSIEEGIILTFNQKDNINNTFKCTLFCTK